MSDTDYYELLGVSRGVDEKALKSAFRKKAMKYHPDRNPDDPSAEAKFKEVSSAYECLSDPQKRAAYDQYGRAAYEQGGMGNAGSGGGGFGGQRPEDVFSDIFADFFGGRQGGGRGGPARGADLRYDYNISLEEAFGGKQADIEIPTTEACKPCDGSGAAKGSSPVTCSTCHGAGRVRAQQGFFTMERTCSACQGRGKVIKNPCKGCGGRGNVHAERTLNVNIPAGIEDGQRIRLQGEGEAGDHGGPKGDLYIFVSVEEHELFERDGPNLYARAPVPFCKAALGGDIDMPTIGGSLARITIPEGAQTGKRMRLKGKGMPSLRSGQHGDLYVELFVETPRNLSSKQKEILREFSESCDEDTNPEHKGFISRVKGFFDASADAD